MTDAAVNRWTGDAMKSRVRKRYAAERRFRTLGFAAVALSVAFLAFLLITMASRGIGGFTQTEARLTIDFPRSDLMLDPATLQGPDAEGTVAHEMNMHVDVGVVAGLQAVGEFVGAHLDLAAAVVAAVSQHGF